mgnify:CR=1 FL=1
MVDLVLTNEQVIMALLGLIAWQTVNIQNLLVRMARMDEQIKNILNNLKGE